MAEGYCDARGYVLPGVIEVREIGAELAQTSEQDTRDSPLSVGGYRLDPTSMVARAVFALAGEAVADARGIAYTQLRRFYQQARAVEQRLRMEKDFAAVLADLAMLRPNAAMAVKRGVAPSSFKDFIDTNVDLATESHEALRKGFLPHFQALLCYYKYYNPNR